MKELKTIEQIESRIKDPRFLALFRAFVKATQSKDYRIMRKLTILRYIIGKLEKMQFEYGLKLAYKIVYNTLLERDYFYWERKLLTECTDINN